MTQKKRNRRNRHFVDSEVQTALLKQCAVHWGLFGLAAFIMLFLLHWIVTPARHSFAWHVNGLWDRYGLIAVILFVLLPVFVLDLLKFTNRFVGPIVQLRRAVRGLARGEEVKPLKFRKGDFWRELAEEFNSVLKQRQQQAQTASRLGVAPPAETAVKHAETQHADDEQLPEPALAAADH